MEEVYVSLTLTIDFMWYIRGKVGSNLGDKKRYNMSYIGPSVTLSWPNIEEEMDEESVIV